MLMVAKVKRGRVGSRWGVSRMGSPSQLMQAAAFGRWFMRSSRRRSRWDLPRVMQLSLVETHQRRL